MRLFMPFFEGFQLDGHRCLEFSLHKHPLAIKILCHAVMEIYCGAACAKQDHISISALLLRSGGAQAEFAGRSNKKDDSTCD